MGLLEQFKKNKQAGYGFETSKTLKPIDVYFVLQADEKGAYIEVTDKKGNKTDADYRIYSGVTRSILKSVEQIKQKNDFSIDWENPENKLYLFEHPYLIGELLRSQQLINKAGAYISANNNAAKLILNIEEEGNQFKTTVSIITSETEYTEFNYINENHALLTNENAIIETQEIGRYFNSIKGFNSKISKDDLQKYLSILFSYVDNIEVQYAEFTIVHIEDKIATQPMLVFEKVDEDNALHMRVSQRLPYTDADFMDEYDLYKFASINELEKNITIRSIYQLPHDRYISYIEGKLEKHAGKTGKKKATGIILEGDLFIISDDIAAAFIYKDIPELLSEYAIVGAEKLKQYKIHTAHPKLNMNMSHGIDFLEGDASLQFGEFQVSLFDALNQFNKNRYIVLANGDHALVNEAYMLKLQRLFKKRKDNVAISFFDLPLVEELIDAKTAEVQFKKSKDVFEGFNKLSVQKVKLPKVAATLRDYQVQGYKWLKYLHDTKLGGCLADDMGLGKTLQAITMLTGIYAGKHQAKPSLIVMPRSLLFNWEAEVRKFATELTTYTYYAGTRNIDDAMQANLIFTTYAMMRNDIEQLKDKEFYYVILDESQNIKNMQTQASKAVMLLSAEHRLALSGTPIENNLGELYSLFRFLNPSMFGSAEMFTNQYLTPIQKHDDKTATADLRRKIYPFILRRLKKDVLTELPDKIEQTLFVEMSDDQAKYYEQRRQYYKTAIEQQVALKGIQQAQFFIFQAMNELRQIASIPEAQTSGRIASPKAELLVEQVFDAVANNHKVLVFCNFLHAVEQISEQLNEQGIDFVTMTGSTRNRQELVERFQHTPSCKVFLLTLKTGGTGLNLTAADIVFIFDPWWNRAAESQAIDRAHRMGQQSKVLSYRLITMGTIEEKILQLQEKKSQLFQNIISDDNASLKALSEDDISFILGR